MGKLPKMGDPMNRFKLLTLKFLCTLGVLVTSSSAAWAVSVSELTGLYDDSCFGLDNLRCVGSGLFKAQLTVSAVTPSTCSPGRYLSFHNAGSRQYFMVTGESSGFNFSCVRVHEYLLQETPGQVEITFSARHNGRGSYKYFDSFARTIIRKDASGIYRTEQTVSFGCKSDIRERNCDRSLSRQVISRSAAWN